MSVERFCVKLFASKDWEDDSILIDIFHGWIRDKILPATMIDVADYRHVPNGPGIMLVTHEINFSMDRADNQLGLLAQRKLGDDKPQPEKIANLVRTVAKFGQLLEEDSRTNQNLSFDGGKFLFSANDRLKLPNSKDTFDSIRPDLEAASAQIYSNAENVDIRYVEGDSRDRLSAWIDTGKSTSIAELVTA